MSSPTDHTTTPAPLPHNPQTPARTNDNHHYGSVKAIDISDCITMVEIALERLRHQRGKKKANKHSKPILPHDMDVALTQALMLSKAHLGDYRKQVVREMRTKHEIIQDSSITTERFMDGLTPTHTLKGEPLLEPWESIEKLNALVSLLMASQDEETNEFRIDSNKITWSLNLLAGLLEETEKRAWDLQSHCRDLWGEFKDRLGKYYLVRRDLAKRVRYGTEREVLS